MPTTPPPSAASGTTAPASGTAAPVAGTAAPVAVLGECVADAFVRPPSTDLAAISDLIAAGELERAIGFNVN